MTEINKAALAQETRLIEYWRKKYLFQAAAVAVCAGAAIAGCFISLIALLSGGETLVPLTTGIVLTVLGGLIFLTTKNK